MPLRKSAIILSFCVLGLALFFWTRTVKAQSCPVLTCDCGDAVCDEYGNCSCVAAPTCDCGSATCNSGAWACAEAQDCSVYGDCYSLSCDGGSWSCDYDESLCPSTCDQCYCDPSYCPVCDTCDPSCWEYDPGAGYCVFT